jgi:S-formylglutathione hydrolase FrmB
MRERLPVLADRAHTAVLGYSTGGRGAIVVSERYPEFAAAASLSGTYDLSLLEPTGPTRGEYAIHAAVFGPRDAFDARWASEDCISDPKLEALQPVGLFIGHGEKDGAVPVSQARGFERALRTARHPRLEVIVEPGAGHDFAYWNRALPQAFESIARRLASSPRTRGPLEERPSADRLGSSPRTRGPLEERPSADRLGSSEP